MDEAKKPHQAINSDFLDVRLFHAKFFQPTDMPVPDGSGVEPPRLMNGAEFSFRRKFLFEEFDEYAVAFNKGNIIKAADALFDLQYVIFGTILYMRAGAGFFVHQGWPTFDYVTRNARALGILHGAPSVPRLLTQNAHNVMHTLMQAQLHVFELTHESAEPNAVSFSLGGLWNLSYSVYLTAALMGIPWPLCWQHVQNANFSKVKAKADGSDSMRGTGMDVVKPVGWCAPDHLIAIELRQAGADIPEAFFEDAKKSSLPKS